jgi:hypothetical protein
VREFAVRINIARIHMKRIHVVLILFLLAFCARFLCTYFQPFPGYFWHTDAKLFYWPDALGLVETGKLANHGSSPCGLPILLAPFVVCNVSPFHVVLIWQSMVGALSALLAMIIVEEMSEKVSYGFIAGIWIAFYPPLLNLSRQLLTETWFITFLFFGLYLVRRKSPFPVVLGGACVGFTALIRSPGLGVVLALLGFFFLVPAQRAKVFPFFIGAGCVIAAGSWLTSYSADHFVFLSEQSGVAMIYKPVLGGYESVNSVGRNTSYFGFLVHNPGAFLEERLISAITLFSPWPFGGRSFYTKIIICVSDAIVFGVFAIAVVLAIRKRLLKEEWFVLLAPFFGLAFFYVALFSQPRYRWQFMPFLICFSVVVFSEVMRQREENSVGKAEGCSATAQEHPEGIEARRRSPSISV